MTKNISGAEQRILYAAVQLFAERGFHGTSTRDISRAAEVSETTLFRCFASKNELFWAAAESELANVRVSADKLSRMAAANDPASSLRALFELITELVLSRPELIRLLYFGVLEFGAEMEAICRKHIGPVVDASARLVGRCTADGALPHIQPRIAVLSFLGTVLVLQNFYGAFAGEPLPFDSVQSAACAYAQSFSVLLQSQRSAPASTLHENVAAAAQPVSTSP